MATNETEDYSQPILLQKTADEWVHRDELLFQVTHQSSELWLKLGTRSLR